MAEGKNIAVCVWLVWWQRKYGSTRLARRAITVEHTQGQSNRNRGDFWSIRNSHTHTQRTHAWMYRWMLVWWGAQAAKQYGNNHFVVSCRFGFCQVTLKYFRRWNFKVRICAHLSAVLIDFSVEFFFRCDEKDLLLFRLLYWLALVQITMLLSKWMTLKPEDNIRFLRTKIIAKSNQSCSGIVGTIDKINAIFETLMRNQFKAKKNHTFLKPSILFACNRPGTRPYCGKVVI